MKLGPDIVLNENLKSEKIDPKFTSVDQLFKSILKDDKTQFDSLKSMKELDQKSLGSDRFLIMFDGALKVIQVLNRDLKKVIRKSTQEEMNDEFHGNINFSKLKLRKATSAFTTKKRITKIDAQLAAYVANKMPLTKKLYQRLQSLEASGDIIIENLKTKDDIKEALVDNRDKVKLSNFDLNLVQKIKNTEQLSSADLKRADALRNEGYLSLNLSPTEKFKSTKLELIKKGLLDDRTEQLIEHQEKFKGFLNGDQKNILNAISETEIRSLLEIYEMSNNRKDLAKDLFKLKQFGFIREREQGLPEKNAVDESEENNVQSKVVLYELTNKSRKIIENNYTNNPISDEGKDVNFDKLSPKEQYQLTKERNEALKKQLEEFQLKQDTYIKSVKPLSDNDETIQKELHLKVAHLEKNYKSLPKDKQNKFLKDSRPMTEISIDGRKLSRKLNSDQMNLMRELQTFSNMSESQLYSIYKDNNREAYFESDMRKLSKKGILKKEVKQFKDYKFNLYNLSYTGNKLTKEFNKYELSTYSKKYTKNNKEILHDLLQYESYRIFLDKNKQDNISIVSIKTDKEKRSDMYKELIKKHKESGKEYKNFSNVQNSQRDDYGDVEIAFSRNNENLENLQIEVDRGYDAQVIRKKSSTMPNMIWVTDSEKQAKRIHNNASNGYQAIWVVS